MAMVVNVYAKPPQLMMELAIVFSTKVTVCTDSKHLVSNIINISCILKIPTKTSAKAFVTK